MPEFAPIFTNFSKALIIISVVALAVLVLVIAIAVRLVKGSKNKDGKPPRPALKAAAMICYIILALLLTSPFWIGFTPIMDKLKEIV